MYNYNFKTNRTNSTAKKESVRPGSYTSKVVSVSWDEDYIEEAMLLILYQLTDKDGKTFPFNERFFNITNNERTERFLDYLSENGVDDIFCDYVGKEESVVIKKVPQENGRVFLNIVQRDFIN